MKAAILCPDDLSIMIVCKGLVTALAGEGGYQVYAVTPVRQNVVQEIEGLGAIHIPVEMDRFISPVNDFKYMLALYRIFKAEKFDLVINFATKTIIYGAIAARMTGIKRVVCAVRGLGIPFMNESGIKSKLLRFTVSRLYALACSLSSTVWFTNEGDLNLFVSSGLVNKEKIILTRNAIDTKYFSPASVQDGRLQEIRSDLGLEPQDKVIVMVARMIWPKGIREFIEAAEITQETHPRTKFLLVAPPEPGSPQSIPESYVKEKEKSGRFLWLGFRRDVREIYALSDIAVLPSYYKEGGYPRALLEPMAMGKPVITTNTVDCRRPVEDNKNGYLVPPRDADALAKAITVLLNDEHKRQEFGRYSRMKVEREFSEKMVVNQVMRELRQS